MILCRVGKLGVNAGGVSGTLRRTSRSYFSLDYLMLDVSGTVDCLKKHRRALRLAHRL